MARVCFLCATDISGQLDYCPLCGMAQPSEAEPIAAPSGGSAAVPSGGPELHERLVQATRLDLVSPATPPGLVLGTGAAVRHGEFRLSGRAKLIAGMVAGVVIVGFVAYLMLNRPATPGSVVSDYFAALANGDTAEALKLVDQGSIGSTSEDPLLVPGVLSQAADRPTDLKVLSVDPAVAGDPSGFQAVHVSYQIAGGTVTQTVTAVKGTDGYLLRSPFISLFVSSSAGRTVSVNGVSVPTGGLNGIAAFPARYQAKADASAVLAGQTAPATVTSASTPDQPAFGIDLTTSLALAPGASDAIQQQIHRVIDQCAAQTADSSITCPFNQNNLYVGGALQSVQWSITTYPTVTITVAANPSDTEQADFSATANDGSAHYTATYTDYTGATQTSSGDVPFGMNGAAAANGNQITLTLR